MHCPIRLEPGIRITVKRKYSLFAIIATLIIFMLLTMCLFNMDTKYQELEYKKDLLTKYPANSQIQNELREQWKLNN